MRSATIIAGAIAIAICLISGALVYAAGKDGDTEVRRVFSKPAIAEGDRRAREAGGEQQGIIKSCGREVGVGPETSCDLGLEVWEQAQGSIEPQVAVIDPDSGEDLSLRCEAGGASASILCSGDGATVYLASR